MGAVSVTHIADSDSNSTGEIIVQDDRTLSDAQAQLRGRLAGQYAGLISAGRIYNGKIYQIDQASAQNISGAATLAVASVAAGVTWPAGFHWIAADNSQTPMAAADMIAFGQNIAGYLTGLIYANRALKDAISALTSIVDCDAFDVTQAWPTNP